ncbi:MAG: hypothetical protein JO262_17675 [Solirubrobacterales bacterium]|nr:hypothetical protein [Solirubrobacterales bacterium]
MSTATGTRPTASRRRAGAMRLPRTTGALSGALIILLGAWGALIPFIGPYFHYAFGGFQTWHYTSQRLWLCIVPGAVAVIGGLMLMRATTRVGGLTAGWVALAAGVWFAVGPSVSMLWHHTIYAIGAPAGGYTRQTLEWVGYFYGLGAAIIGLAAFAMGRYFSRPRVAGEAVAVAEAAPVAEEGRVAHEAPGARTTAATAEAPVAERRVGDAPAAERADAPAVDREAYAERADAPAADREAYAGRADAPADREAHAERTDAPAADQTAYAPAADSAAGSDAPADAPGTSYRRRPGLFRRLRG